ANQLENADKKLLMSVSRVILHAGGPSFRSQIRLPKSLFHEEKYLKRLDYSTQSEKLPKEAGNDPIAAQLDDTSDWQFFNSWGGFSPDGKEYRILLRNKNYLPSPWINVLANPKFGCYVSELVTGYTWWRNSRECKLTP